MAAIAFLAALAVAAAASQASDARLLNLDELITVQDYPRISLVNNEQGSVTVRLKIDESGLVRSCRVARSSGHVALDEQTCALFRARARFEPAKDRSGRPVRSDHTQKISWKLADRSVAMPRQAWMIRVTLGLNRDGAIGHCKMEAAGVVSKPLDCEVLLSATKASGGDGPSFANIAGFAITETHFYPIGAGKVAIPPALAGATKVAQQISNVVIEADGRISGCEGIRYSGAASPATDACRILTGTRFEAGPAGAKPLVGTVVTTAYTQTQTIT